MKPSGEMGASITLVGMPGSVYTAAVAQYSTVGMYRVEVSVSSGSGKLKTGGGEAEKLRGMMSV
jgi:predicted ATP-dependent Lon-type protease